MILKRLWACIAAAAVTAAVMPCAVSYAAAPGAAYEYSSDVRDDVFQYHFAGGTDAFMSGVSSTGRVYDAYLWVPQSVSPGELKGLVAVKSNLIEVPFVESSKLRDALEKDGFGILWLVFAKDSHGYNNTFSSFNTRTDYKGDVLYSDASSFTSDGKDAADIMDDILNGIAAASGYAEIADETPLITIGHSAASPFGYRSGNWDPDRIIAQVQMKNGMGAPLYQSNEGVVPGIPCLQYAAQYTEHALGADRDRSVRDARWHIANQRAENTDMLVSHIIEWGSGHYDWSDNATDMMIRYIEKAIEYRLPDNYAETGKLNDLTGSGYLMKPFEKDENGSERAAGYYKEHGWLSDGQANSSASEADRQASFWFFDEDFAKEVAEFTDYAIPESPDPTGTGIEGKTYSDIEPFMLMKDPSKSTHADTPYTEPTVIAPFLEFNSGMSRYGNTRFVDYEKLGKPGGNAENSANLQGYDTVTVDTYYMSKIPSAKPKGSDAFAYDGVGDEAYVPENTKAELVPLMAPYEIVKSEIVPMEEMTRAEGNDEAGNVASVTRTTLRFHNNRVYYRAGCSKTNEYGTQLDSFGMILSPEISENGEVTSSFKATGVQMNVPYTGKGSQTLTLDPIANVNINDTDADTKIDVSCKSSNSDLQKYTDVFVEYGPARAVRTVGSDGSYSWQIEILEDEIPEDAEFPIEVNVVASNLGKWETVAAASAEQKFYITDKDTLSGVYLDGEQQISFDAAVDAAHDGNEHTVTVYSNSTAGKLHDLTASEKVIFENGDFAAEVKQTSSNMMFLNKDTSTAPELTFGKPSLSATERGTALTFNMDGKGRFAEINKGTLDLYNGVVITGGKDNRGGGIDCKTGSVLNIHGGIITGNTASAAGTLGGGGVSVVGYGTANMDGGIITGNTSENSLGGGLSVMENGSFNMSGGSISGNTGYDVYVNNNNMTISGSAEIGSLYLAEGKTMAVNGAFTSDRSHAQITPGMYAEGTELVRYAEGLTPSAADFTVAADPDGTQWYLYADGQSLRLTKNAPFAITAMNGIAVKSEAYAGEAVTLTVPEGYVENSLVVSGINPSDFTEISDRQYSFDMPENSVTVSCLVNTDSRKVIVVGEHDTYFVRNDNDMNVTFNVPGNDTGYVYSNAEVAVPVREHTYNALNMTAEMNGESYSIENCIVSGSGNNINAGVANVLTVTNENSAGVDYYSYSNNNPSVYPRTAEDLSTLTLTKAVSAEAERLTAEGVENAEENSDAVGFYIENMVIPSWNPSLKWQLMFDDGVKAEKNVNIPMLSGEGSISFGIVLSGTIDKYTTSDIESVYVVE